MQTKLVELPTCRSSRHAWFHADSVDELLGFVIGQRSATPIPNMLWLETSVSTVPSGEASDQRFIAVPSLLV
jgi:hypothetical protein